jgi:aspartate 1-decarboxylase
MFVKILKSKLHCARVTETKLHYAGSVAVDPELMNAVGFLPYESVIIADLNNVVMGAAARLVNPKDVVIIFSFAFVTPEEAKEFKPKVIALDEKNRIAKKIS